MANKLMDKPLCWCDGEPTCTGVSDEGEYGLCRSCRQMGHSKLQPLPFSMLGDGEKVTVCECDPVPLGWDRQRATYAVDGTERCRRCQLAVLAEKVTDE